MSESSIYDPNTLLDRVMEIDGALGTTVISMADRAPLSYRGALNLESAIIPIIELTIHKTMISNALKVTERTSDVVFTYDNQLHIANPIYSNATMIFTVFDSSKVNIAIARRSLQMLADLVVAAP